MTPDVFLRAFHALTPHDVVRLTFTSRLVSVRVRVNHEVIPYERTHDLARDDRGGLARLIRHYRDVPGIRRAVMDRVGVARAAAS